MATRSAVEGSGVVKMPSKPYCVPDADWNVAPESTLPFASLGTKPTSVTVLPNSALEKPAHGGDGQLKNASASILISSAKG